MHPSRHLHEPTQPYVTFTGQYHTLDRVGLNRGSLPRTPIWFGTESGDKALRRVAKLADGWMSLGDPTADLSHCAGIWRRLGATLDNSWFVDRCWLTTVERQLGSRTADDFRHLGLTHLFVVAPPTVAPVQALPGIIEVRKALSEALG